MCVSPTTPNIYISKWFRFITAKTYNILQYVIPHILRHMCNLHIKGTEISQKRSKGIKNWKITYSVILSVLSNKTNLILGFSSPLTSIFSLNSMNEFEKQVQTLESVHPLISKYRQPKLTSTSVIEIRGRTLTCVWTIYYFSNLLIIHQEN